MRAVVSDTVSMRSTYGSSPLGHAPPICGVPTSAASSASAKSSSTSDIRSLIIETFARRDRHDDPGHSDVLPQLACDSDSSCEILLVFLASQARGDFVPLA